MRKIKNILLRNYCDMQFINYRTHRRYKPITRNYSYYQKVEATVGDNSLACWFVNQCIHNRLAARYYLCIHLYAALLSHAWLTEIVIGCGKHFRSDVWRLRVVALATRHNSNASLVTWCQFIPGCILSLVVRWLGQRHFFISVSPHTMTSSRGYTVRVCICTWT